MNSMFIDILKKLTAEQGKEALLNPAKCKALLADYTKGEHKKESRLLLQAIDAGVQKAIDTTTELELCKRQQVRMLHEEYGIDQEIAADIVDTLALVLKGVQESETIQSTVCSNCGKELQKEWASCPYCSTPVVKIQQKPPETEAPPGLVFEPTKEETPPLPDSSPDEQTPSVTLVVQPQLNKKNNTKRNLIIAGVVLLVILILIIGGIRESATVAPVAENSNSNQQSAQEFYDRGVAFLKQGNEALAIQNFENALSLDPNNNLIKDYLQQARNFQSVRTFNDKGVAYFNNNDYDNAITQFNEAIRLNPNDGIVYAHRGSAYWIKGQYDMAIKDLDIAINRAPDYAFAYAVRGDVYRIKHQYDMAIKDCTEAIKIDPDYAFAYASRGVAYNQKGQKDRAIQDLEKAISLDPNYGWAKDKLKEIRGY